MSILPKLPNGLTEQEQIELLKKAVNCPQAKIKLILSLMRLSAKVAISCSPKYYREDAIANAFWGMIKGVDESIVQKLEHLNLIKAYIRGYVLKTIKKRYSVNFSKHGILCLNLDFDKMKKFEVKITSEDSDIDLLIRKIKTDDVDVEILTSILEGVTYKKIQQDLKLSRSQFEKRISIIKNRFLDVLKGNK